MLSVSLFFAFPFRFATRMINEAVLVIVLDNFRSLKIGEGVRRRFDFAIGKILTGPI